MFAATKLTVQMRLLITFLILIYSFFGFTQSNALDLEGSNGDYINCGNDASLDITGTTITLEAWIMPESIPSNVWEGNVINKSGTGDQGYMLRIGGTGQVNFNIGDWGWNELTSPNNVISTGNWYHVAAVYDGSNQIIYVNGTQVAIAAAPGISNIGFASSALWLGDDPVWNGRYYDGKIEEVKIWNSARTPAQVNSDMNPICAPYPAELVAYYKFNQGISGGGNAGINTVLDATCVNHGNLVNSSLSGTSSNWITGRNDVLGNASFNLTNSGCTEANTNIIGDLCGVFQWNPDPADGAILDYLTGSITNGTAGSTYSIEYTICGSVNTESITLPSTGDPSFSYNPSCGGAVSVVSGDIGGTFSFNPAPGDGAIVSTTSGNISNASAGSTYYVQYSVCGTSNTQSITVLNDNCFSIVNSSDAQFITVNGEQCIQLTAAANDETGCAWNGNQIDFNSDFSLNLDYYFGNNPDGADGTTFTFQPTSPSSCGEPGAMLGAGGSGVTDALIIEFDTYDNDGGTGNDLSSDHIAIEIDEILVDDPSFGYPNSAPLCGPVEAISGGANIDDGNVHNVEIVWDASNNVLEIYFDGDLRLSCNHDFVTNAFGGNNIVYWGATGATGGLNNQQYFCPSTVVILPIELSDFYSVCDENREVIHWVSESEKDLVSYDLEYTLDGVVFHKLKEVYAAGTTDEKTSYSVTIDSIPTGAKYYRLTTRDIDGRLEHSDLISGGNCWEKGTELIQSVAQRDSEIIVELNAIGFIIIYDEIGRTIEKSETGKSFTLNTGQLSTGLYHIRAADTNEVLHDNYKFLVIK